MAASYLHIDPVLSDSDADDMLRIAESFGSFGTYADEATNDGLRVERRLYHRKQALSLD